VAVRLFYDFLIEEGVRDSNPVGRGRYTPRGGMAARKGLVPRMVKLPWIPAEQQWLDVLGVFRAEPVRNRLMLAMAYDGALRREELCSLRTDDVDPGQRMLSIRAETTKTRRGRAVPYSAATGALLAEYLAHRSRLSRARGPLFLSESRRNTGDPLTLWTWSKLVFHLSAVGCFRRVTGPATGSVSTRVQIRRSYEGLFSRRRGRAPAPRIAWWHGGPALA
jgi:integrase